ncbi:MAG: hypothetical protein LBK73_07305 [Treponema sp.]|jgi:hypothetical protein|nr:hypothetical protein [Treponema sp.]
MDAKTPFYAPHFTERTRSLLLNYTESLDGASGDQIQRPVKTTLDLDLQLYVEERPCTELAKLALIV